MNTEETRLNDVLAKIDAIKTIIKEELEMLEYLEKEKKKILERHKGELLVTKDYVIEWQLIVRHEKPKEARTIEYWKPDIRRRISYDAVGDILGI